MPTNAQKLLWIQSWNHGNYVQAYKTQDFNTAQSYAIRPRDCSAHEKKAKDNKDILKHAFTLGFFASYEYREIPEKHRAAYRHAKVFARVKGFALGID
jgi:hypothetical protein